MQILRHIHLMVATLAVAAIGASSHARTISEFFTDSVAAVPLIDRNTRLDMVDYFNTGFDKASATITGGNVRIVAMDSVAMAFESGEGWRTDMALLPAGRDTMILVVETLAFPQRDSRVTVYTADWQRPAKTVFEAPVLADWLTDFGRANRAEVERVLPYILVQTVYNPEQKLLLLANGMDSYYADGPERDLVRQALRPNLTYTFDGRRFSRK